MGVYSSKKSIVSVFIIWLFLCSFAVAQEKEEVTVEWINSDVANTIQSVPHFLWLDKGTAILLDIHKSKEERTFEKLDPDKRKLTPILDMEKAVVEAILNSMFKAWFKACTVEYWDGRKIDIEALPLDKVKEIMKGTLKK